MSNTYTLKAELRTRVGKGSSRELRNRGLLPAVIYGNKQTPLAIAVPYKDVYYKIYGGGFRTTLVTIELDGKKIVVLPKDYQLEPVKDTPLHVDFLRVTADTIVNLELPLHFLNSDDAAGVKRGGVLNIVSHTLLCSVQADNIPEAIEIDLADMEIGHTLHAADITLPKGVNLVANEEQTIATITGSAESIEETTETE